MRIEKRVLFLLLTLVFSTTVTAKTAVDQSLAVPSDALISIDNTRGEVTIIGWDQAKVTVKGDLDDLAEAFIFDLKDQQVVIEVKVPRLDLNRGNGSNLTIQVPQESRVRFVGVSTDVEIENIRGGVQVQLVSGDLEARRIESQLLINTVSGDIEINGVIGSVLASTISGDLELVTTAKSLRLDTVSGDVDLTLKAFDQLAVHSVSGSMEIDGELNPAGQIELASVSGDIRLGLQPGLNATLDLDGGISGDIVNDLSDDEVETRFPSRQRLRAIVGDGSGRIGIRTVSADITLKEN
jgi:hypothetical protein